MHKHMKQLRIDTEACRGMLLEALDTLCGDADDCKAFSHMLLLTIFTHIAQSPYVIKMTFFVLVLMCPSCAMYNPCRSSHSMP